MGELVPWSSRPAIAATRKPRAATQLDTVPERILRRCAARSLIWIKDCCVGEPALGMGELPRTGGANHPSGRAKTGHRGFAGGIRAARGARALGRRGEFYRNVSDLAENSVIMCACLRTGTFHYAPFVRGALSRGLDRDRPLGGAAGAQF